MAAPFGGFNLPGPGPTTGQNISNAMGQLPGMLNQQQMDKYAVQKEKAQAEQLQQTQDMARLKLMYRMKKNATDAGLQVNPQVEQNTEKLAKSLGVGSFMHVDPASGQQIVDWDAIKKFATMKDPSDLTDAEWKEVASTPKKDRPAKLAEYGVDSRDVDPRILTAAVEMDEYKKTLAINRITTQISEYAKGNNSVSGLKAQIAAARSTFDDMGIDFSELESTVNSDEFRADLSQGVMLKAQAMRDAHMKADAVTRWTNARINKIPYEIQDLLGKQDYRSTMGGAAIANVQLRQAEFADRKTNELRNFNEQVSRDQVQARHLDAVTADLNAGRPLKYSKFQYDAMKGAATRWTDLLKPLTTMRDADINAQVEVPPELLAQIKQATEKAAAANAAVDAMANQMPYDAARRATAASGKQVTDPNAGKKMASKAGVIEAGRKRGLTPAQAIKEAQDVYGYTVQ